MFFKKSLFRRDIEPRCAYCARGGPLDDQTVTCHKRGVVSASGHCRSFQYDPLRRVPPRPAVLRTKFSDADFALEDQDET